MSFDLSLVFCFFLLDIYTLNENVSGNFKEISYISISKYYQFYVSSPLQIFAYQKELWFLLIALLSSKKPFYL